MTEDETMNTENISGSEDIVDDPTGEKTPVYVGRVLPIKSIIYKDGWRREFGDIMPFARNIKKIGLLNPITVVRSGTKYEIVTGHRRYEAVKKLGWGIIEVRMKMTDIIISKSPCVVCGYKIAEETFGTSLCANHQMMFVMYYADDILWNSVKEQDKEGVDFVEKTVSSGSESDSSGGAMWWGLIDD